MIRLAVALISVMFCASAFAADDGGFRCSPDEKIVLAAEDGFFPYTGIYKGALRGFSLDIVAAAYDAVGCSLQLVQMPYNRCIREVQTGRHTGCFNTTNSEDNRQKYIFHREPLFRGKILIYAPPTYSGTFTAAEYKRSTFSVVRGYTYIDAFDNDPDIQKIEVETDLQTLALVARGRADFAVVYEKVAQFHIGNNADRILPAPVPVADLVDYDLFVSFSKADIDKSVRLAHFLDVGLARIRANGVYSGIEASWDKWLKVGVREGKPAPHWTSSSS